MNLSKYKNSFYIIVISLLVACKGEDGAVGPSGLNSLIQTSTELAGSNCEFGGLKVETGIDNNSNGTLDPDEVLKTDYICSVAGKNSLVNVVDEPAGTTCPNGGIKIDTGIDEDEDGTLDQEEIQITRYVCNGIDGSTIEEIRFKLITLTGGGTSSASGSILSPWQNLVNFDKNLFPDMTSATLVAHIQSSDASNTCFVDLYDVDNDSGIANSEISTNSTDRVWVESTNVLSNLPSTETDLVIRVRTETEGVFVNVWQAYLILRRE